MTYDSIVQLNVRLPASLKEGIESAAKKDKVSVNEWIRKVAAASLVASPVNNSFETLREKKKSGVEIGEIDFVPVVTLELILAMNRIEYYEKELDCRVTSLDGTFIRRGDSQIEYKKI